MNSGGMQFGNKVKVSVHRWGCPQPGASVLPGSAPRSHPDSALTALQHLAFLRGCEMSVICSLNSNI